MVGWGYQNPARVQNQQSMNWFGRIGVHYIFPIQPTENATMSTWWQVAYHYHSPQRYDDDSDNGDRAEMQSVRYPSKHSRPARWLWWWWASSCVAHFDAVLLSKLESLQFWWMLKRGCLRYSLECGICFATKIRETKSSDQLWSANEQINEHEWIRPRGRSAKYK